MLGGFMDSLRDAMMALTIVTTAATTLNNFRILHLEQ